MGFVQFRYKLIKSHKNKTIYLHCCWAKQDPMQHTIKTAINTCCILVSLI